MPLSEFFLRGFVPLCLRAFSQKHLPIIPPPLPHIPAAEVVLQDRVDCDEGIEGGAEGEGECVKERKFQVPDAARVDQDHEEVDQEC